MICFIALFVFSVLSLFSAKYRPLAAAAFECTFRRLTLRPCQTDLETRVRTEFVGVILPLSPPLARLVHRHFEILGNLFTLLMVLSLAYSLWGAYNFVQFGTCDPSDPSAFCIYRDLLGGGGAADISQLVPPANREGLQSSGAPARVSVVEFGCLTCPYTRRAEPAVSELLKSRAGQIRYVFKPFPLPAHNNSRAAALALLCSANPSPMHLSPNSSIDGTPAYWAYRAAVFERQDGLKTGTGALAEAAQAAGLSSDFYACLNDSEARYGNYLDARIAEGKAARVYGTPTFFVNNRPLVGPVPTDTLIRAVDEELAKAQK